MRTRTLVSVIATVALLAACAPASQSTTGGAASGPNPNVPQTLKVATLFLPAALAPSESATSPYVYWPLYDNLTQFGENFEVKPSVATAWRLMPDGLTWQFTIRDDMVWPDGQRLTAEDVAFTMNTTLQRRWRQSQFFASVSGARVIDATTVEFATRTRDMAVPSNAPFLWILPKHYFERVGFEEFLRKPMGSGPYELVEFNSVQRAVFKKRSTPHAFRAPVADDLIFLPIPEPGQIINGLRTGELDMATFVTFTPEQLTTIKKADLQIIAPQAVISMMQLSQSYARAHNTPLTDIRVRQALFYAIDTPTLARAMVGEYALPVGQFAMPGSFYWDPSVKPFPFDRAKAKQLLAEAGYPNGFNLGRMDVFLNAPEWPSVAQFVQQQFRDIGVQVEINVYSDVPTFLDRFYGRQARAPLFSGSFQTTPAMDAAFGFDWYLGTRPMPERFYNNPEFDRVYLPSQTEMNEQRRAQLLQQAAAIMREDAPVIFLVGGAWIWAANNKIDGLTARTDLDPRFERMRRLQ
ncbi:MAG: ABC transporter substrate-binding protein [Dehalococcoidia bacterium]|nr:ABC transporter substrate-binding protein [Dehalococcoidia bacterium]